MAANSTFTPVVTRLGCLRGVSTLTAFGLATEIGDWGRLWAAPSVPTSGWCPPSTPRERLVPKVGSPRPATAMPAGDNRSGLASPSALSTGTPSTATVGNGLPGSPGTRTCSQPAPTRPMGPFRRAQETLRGRQRGDRPRTRRLVLVDSRPRRLTPSNVQMSPARSRQASRSDPRPFYEQSRCSATDHARSARPAIHSDPKLPSCGSQPANIRLTRVDTTRSTPQRTQLVYEAAATATVAAAASPCPLDRMLPISERRRIVVVGGWCEAR